MNHRASSYKPFALALILLCAVAYAKDKNKNKDNAPKAYQSGKLLQMDSVQCGADDPAGKNNNARNNKQTAEPSCQEYVLQTDRVVYRIRAADEKHSVLLPVGEAAQFRPGKNKNNILLRVQGLDNKERPYNVVSMSPLSDNTADARPVRLNHLQ